jgi:hypothetical protein
VQKLLEKVQSTLDRVCEISAPELTSSTLNGVLEALAMKEDGEDSLIAAVRQQVITGSESVFSMLMMHGVNCNFDKITSTYPKGKDGRDVPHKEYLERAWWLTSWQSGTLRRKLLASEGASRRVNRLVGLLVVRRSLLKELKLCCNE